MGHAADDDAGFSSLSAAPAESSVFAPFWLAG
jgi:hypothetical protein